MSILNGVFSLGYVVGTTLGGRLYKKYANYYLNFGISCGLSVIGVMYTLMFIKESIVIDEDTKITRKGFFNFDNVKESLRTAFMSRPGSGRIRVILLIVNFDIFIWKIFQIFLCVSNTSITPIFESNISWLNPIVNSIPL